MTTTPSPPRPASPHAAADLPIREGLSDFIFGAELHRSELGTLHVAERAAQPVGTPLAVVRLLHRGLASDPSACSLVEREAAIGARLRSRNVLTFHPVRQGAERPFSALELVEGLSLAELLARGQGRAELPRLLVPAVVDALAGLAALHELRDASGAATPIAHQAPAPRHILVGLDGVARLADLTQCVGPSFPWSQRCTDRLRAAEMAPEQALAPAHVDIRCDIFIAASTLWHVLTGLPLFSDASPEQSLQKMLRMPVPSLLELGIPVGPRFDRLMRRALTRARADRLGSAAEFAEELRVCAQQAGFYAERDELGQLVASLRRARMLAAPRPAAEAPAPRSGSVSSTRMPTLIGIASPSPAGPGEDDPTLQRPKPPLELPGLAVQGPLERPGLARDVPLERPGPALAAPLERPSLAVVAFDAALSGEHALVDLPPPHSLPVARPGATLHGVPPAPPPREAPDDTDAEAGEWSWEQARAAAERTATARQGGAAEGAPIYADPIHADPIHADPIHADPIHADPIHAAVAFAAAESASDVDAPEPVHTYVSYLPPAEPQPYAAAGYPPSGAAEEPAAPAAHAPSAVPWVVAAGLVVGITLGFRELELPGPTLPPPARGSAAAPAPAAPAASAQTPDPDVPPRPPNAPTGPHLGPSQEAIAAPAPPSPAEPARSVRRAAGEPALRGPARAAERGVASHRPSARDEAARLRRTYIYEPPAANSAPAAASPDRGGTEDVRGVATAPAPTPAALPKTAEDSAPGPSELAPPAALPINPY